MSQNTVKLFVPKVPGDTDPNVVISVNCVNYILPKGMTSVVPDFVAYEYERSVKAASYCDLNVERLMDGLKERAAESIQFAGEIG